MNNETIDYNEVLRDLTDRRDELDAAIRAITRIVGHAVGSPVAAPTPGARQYVRSGDTANGVASPAVAAAATIRAALDKTHP